MNQKNFQAALNHLDEALIESHLRAKTARRPRGLGRFRTVAAVAACVTLVAAGTAVTAILSRADGGVTTLPDIDVDYTSADKVVAIRDFCVYYLAADGSLQYEVQSLACEPETVFAAWREKNGLSEEEAEAVMADLGFAEIGESDRLYACDITCAREERLLYVRAYLQTLCSVDAQLSIELETGDIDGHTVYIRRSGTISAEALACIRELFGERDIDPHVSETGSATEEVTAP